MPHREIPLESVSPFCRPDLAVLANLLDQPFHFQEPFLEAAPHEVCLARLRIDPPDQRGGTLRIHRAGGPGKGPEVAMFRHDRKPGVTLLMAQWVRFRGEKIAEILLFFDSGPFA